MAAMSEKDKAARKQQLEGYMSAAEHDKRVYNESPYKDKRADKEARSKMEVSYKRNERELAGLEGRPPMSKKWIEK